MSKGASKSARPAQVPVSFSTFTILPLTIPATPAYPHATTHYLYVRPSKPSPTDPSPEAAAQRSRELFLSNVPVDATKGTLKGLFNEISNGVGRVEDVILEGEIQREKAKTAAVGALARLAEGGSRKRKRPGMEELEEELQSEESQLPRTWNRELRPAGSSAVVVFVDRASAEAALKEVRRKAKKKEEVVWNSEEKGAPLGSKRYKQHSILAFPSKTLLQSRVNSYLGAYNAINALQARQSRALAEPDEDGFITVTKNASRNAPVSLATAEAAKQRQEERKQKKGDLNDFYRFQGREKRKEKERELRRKFEEDRKKVENMRKARVV